MAPLGKNQASAASANQQVDFLEVCENLYDGIHITDGDGRVLFVNQAYTRTTGIQPEEILGRRVADIEAEGKLYRNAVTDDVLARRSRVDSVATILRLNKEVLVTGIPVFDDAGAIRMVVTNTRDFSELKELERQLQALTEQNRKANAELLYLRQQQAGDKRLLSSSEAMQAVIELISTVASTDVTVLITGESGTGKELVANELYRNSARRGKPFIKVNCAAIPNELLESELFGYEEGAFTGAKRAGKPGLFELANTGIILLDEIGDMPLALQGKLLRVLQQRELMRIGGRKSVPLDLRVLASTNKDLKEAVRQGRFREDLFYRLNVVPITLPSLKERHKDIPLLAEQFCRDFGKKYGRSSTIAPDAMELLASYSWPGNIRELENLIERLVVVTAGETITRDAVFSALSLGRPDLSDANTVDQSLKSRLRAYEAEIIQQTVAREGSLRKAAKVLGVDHSTLVKKMQRSDTEIPFIAR